MRFCWLLFVFLPAAAASTDDRRQRPLVTKNKDEANCLVRALMKDSKLNPRDVERDCKEFVGNEANK